ncbi:MAG: nonstructural protein [Microviridae sp.]|nr:MAG: nonstructural protein [Microviridae sp.]
MFGTKVKHQADLEVFTIFDTKTGSYEIPTLAINHLDLQRQLINMFKNPEQRNNKFLVNAEDYQVFRIATYDRKTGKLEASSMEHICNMHDLRVIAQPSGLVPEAQKTENVTYMTQQ